MAGAKSVLVNNAGYRQTENVWSPAEPGQNVVLTLDLRIQQAAEQALQGLRPGHARRGGRDGRAQRRHPGAGVLARPSIPNSFIPRLSRAECAAHHRAARREEPRHAGELQPGSIFKTVVGLACLEAGLNPKATIDNPGYIIRGQASTFDDLAPPGTYDFRRP